MVLVLTLAPLALEGLLTLADSLRVVEIPLTRLLAGSCWLLTVSPSRTVVHCPVPGLLLLQRLLSLFLLLGSLFFFLFFDKVGNDLVDNLVALFFRHQRQTLQGVLQFYGTGVGHQLVEHL